MRTLIVAFLATGVLAFSSPAETNDVSRRLTPQQVADCQKRTEKLRAQNEATVKSVDKPSALAQAPDSQFTESKRPVPALREEQITALMILTALPGRVSEPSTGLAASSLQTKTNQVGFSRLPTEFSKQTMSWITHVETAEELSRATRGSEKGWKFGAPSSLAANYRPDPARLMADPSLGQARGWTLFHFAF